MTKKRAPGYMPEAAEAPYQVASNVVSRQSYYKHEGDPSEYNQVRELYQRVMTEAQRDNLHKNTADLLRVSPIFCIREEEYVANERVHDSSVTRSSSRTT